MSGETDSIELGSSNQPDSSEQETGQAEDAMIEEAGSRTSVVSLDDIPVVAVIEAALLAAGKPLALEQLAKLFDDDARPDKPALKRAMAELSERCSDRGYELKEVASGWRFQVRQELAPWVGRLWDEKPPRYTRALLETLALIAYRQPITRGEIEDIRGVSVSTNIVRTLQEREWVRIVGHRDVPGRPAMYATTRQFLDYFNLQNLDALPTLSELRDLDEMARKLEGNIDQSELALDDQEKSEQTDVVNGESEDGSDGHDDRNDKEWDASRLVSVEEAQAFREEGEGNIEALFSELDTIESGLTLTYTDYDPRTTETEAGHSGQNSETETEIEAVAEVEKTRSEPGVGPDPDAE